MARSNSARAAQIRAESAALEHTRRLLETVRYDRAEADHQMRVAQQRADDLATRQSLLEARLLSMRETVLALRADYMQDSLNSCPDDVLRYIFHIAVDLPSQDWQTFGFGSYNHDHATIPFTLASVCSRWRRVALHCPMLWTNIDIPSPPLTIAKLNRVDLLLKRSSPCAIDILFGREWQDYEPSIMDDPLHRCIATLADHSARWRRVQLWLIEKDSTAILDVFRGPLPLLVELSLTISDDLDGDARTQKSYLPSAPRLQKLDLAFAGFDISDPDHPGFRSLLNLRCWIDITAETAARLISLSKTTLQHLDTAASGSISPFPLAMPDLRSLCLRRTPFFVHWPPSGLLLPRLTSLSLSSSIISPELEPFLQHVSPTVTCLELFGNVRRTALDTAKLLTKVAHLAIVWQIPDAWSHVQEGEFFAELAGAEPCIWPHLTSIRFDNFVTMDPSNEEGLLRLVKRRTVARTPQTAALRDVEVGYSRAPAWLVAEVARLLEASQ